MTTSEPTSADSTADSWFLELRPLLVQNAQSVTAAAGALSELIEESRGKYEVVLEFDSTSHHERGVELVGLIEATGDEYRLNELSRIRVLEGQINRLTGLIDQQLKQSTLKRGLVAGQRKFLMQPLRRLRHQINQLRKAVLNCISETPPVGDLPDFRSVWVARKEHRARLHHLMSDWQEMNPGSPWEKPALTAQSAWAGTLGKMFELPAGARKGANGKPSPRNPRLDAAIGCFTSDFSSQTSERTLRMTPFRFLGGPVLDLCSAVASSNTGLKALTRTQRWRELLVAVHELHFEAGCVQFRFASRPGSDDLNDDDGQVLLESTLTSLKNFLGHALGKEIEKDPEPIRGFDLHEGAPVPVPTETKPIVVSVCAPDLDDVPPIFLRTAPPRSPEPIFGPSPETVSAAIPPKKKSKPLPELIRGPQSPEEAPSPLYIRNKSKATPEKISAPGLAESLLASSSLANPTAATEKSKRAAGTPTSQTSTKGCNVIIAGPKDQPKVSIGAVEIMRARRNSLLVIFALGASEPNRSLSNADFAKLVARSPEERRLPSHLVRGRMKTLEAAYGLKYIPRDENFEVSGISFDSQLSTDEVKSYLQPSSKK